MAAKKRKKTHHKKSHGKKGWSAAKLSRYKREKRALINKFNRE